MLNKQATWRAAGFGAAFLLSASGAAFAGALDPNGNIVITVDENGHGTANGFTGVVPLPFTLQNDPGPGGLANVLTYSLINPPGLTAGDLLINEPGDGLGDVVRFNPGETCSGGLGCLVFYSMGPPFDSLADAPTPPQGFYLNNLTLTENAAGQVIYTPLPGQPGFVAGAAAPVVYDLISDAAVPAPVIGRGLPSVLGLGILLFGARLLERSKRRRSLGTVVAHAPA